MKPVILLKKLDLLFGKTALDVGAKDCADSIELVSEGFLVDSVDIHKKSSFCDAKDITYIQSRFEDFTTDKKYNLILSRHVLPFLDLEVKDSVNKISGLMSQDAVLYFTVFGPEDDWSINPKIKICSKDEALNIASEIGTVLYHSEEKFLGKTYKGDIKNWHITTIVLKK